MSLSSPATSSAQHNYHFSIDSSPHGSHELGHHLLLQAKQDENNSLVQKWIEENTFYLDITGTSHQVTVLAISVLKSNRSMAVYLVKKGADLFAVDRHQQTPWSLAQIVGDPQIIQLFQERISFLPYPVPSTVEERFAHVQRQHHVAQLTLSSCHYAFLAATQQASQILQEKLRLLKTIKELEDERKSNLIEIAMLKAEGLGKEPRRKKLMTSAASSTSPSAGTVERATASSSLAHPPRQTVLQTPRRDLAARSSSVHRTPPLFSPPFLLSPQIDLTGIPDLSSSTSSTHGASSSFAFAQPPSVPHAAQTTPSTLYSHNSFASLATPAITRTPRAAPISLSALSDPSLPPSESSQSISWFDTPFSPRMGTQPKPPSTTDNRLRQQDQDPILAFLNDLYDNSNQTS